MKKPYPRGKNRESTLLGPPAFLTKVLNYMRLDNIALVLLHTAPAHRVATPAHPPATAYWSCIWPCFHSVQLFIIKSLPRNEDDDDSKIFNYETDPASDVSNMCQVISHANCKMRHE